MAALREMVAPRHASSQRSCSGVNRSGMGRARGIGRGDDLTSVADCDTVGKVTRRRYADRASLTGHRQSIQSIAT